MNGFRIRPSINTSKEQSRQNILQFFLSLFFPNRNNTQSGVPLAVDWRSKGAVTEVKDQGSCGSCWAFASTGALEGASFLKSGQLTSLSEQNLVDCTRGYGNLGCDGGIMDYAYDYIKNNSGIEGEVTYPYTGIEANCTFQPGNSAATISGYVKITRGDENGLLNAVATKGPVAVAMDASSPFFQFYSSGVYSDPLCTRINLNHAV
jgi:cathepsin L